MFKKEDKFHQGLIERERLYQILESLPLGYTLEDIVEIFKDSAIFDAHGNADFTLILQNDVFILLEKLHFQRKLNEQRKMEEKKRMKEEKKVQLVPPVVESNYLKKQIIYR